MADIRDCANCKHYVVIDTRTNWDGQETTKIYGCERWECEPSYSEIPNKSESPTGSDNLSSGLEKNSKKLEKDFGESDCISRVKVIDYLCKHCPDDGECFEDCDEIKHLRNMPPVTPQEPCDKCEVGNPCLYCKHEFEPQESGVEDGNDD